MKWEKAIMRSGNINLCIWEKKCVNNEMTLKRNGEMKEMKVFW